MRTKLLLLASLLVAAAFPREDIPTQYPAGDHIQDRYTDTMIENVQDCMPDYILADGTRGWNWTDRAGNVRIYWKESK